MIEARQNHTFDQRVELAQVGDEAAALVRLAFDAQPQTVVVAVSRQVRALAEAGAVLFLGPIRAAVQMAGAETVTPFEADHHGPL